MELTTWGFGIYGCRCEVCDWGKGDAYHEAERKWRDNDIKRGTIRHMLYELEEEFNDVRQVLRGLEEELSFPGPSSAVERQPAQRRVEKSIKLSELVQEEGLADYYGQTFRLETIARFRNGEKGLPDLRAYMSYHLRRLAEPESSVTEAMREILQLLAVWGGNASSEDVPGWIYELLARYMDGFMDLP